MSELFDKEVNAQKESLKKYFRGSRKPHKPTKKCAMKMKQRNKQRNKEKNDVHVKRFLVEGSPL